MKFDARKPVKGLASEAVNFGQFRLYPAVRCDHRGIVV